MQTDFHNEIYSCIILPANQNFYLQNLLDL